MDSQKQGEMAVHWSEAKKDCHACFWLTARCCICRDMQSVNSVGPWKTSLCLARLRTTNTKTSRTIWTTCTIMSSITARKYESKQPQTRAFCIHRQCRIHLSESPPGLTVWHVQLQLCHFLCTCTAVFPSLGELVQNPYQVSAVTSAAVQAVMYMYMSFLWKTPIPIQDLLIPGHHLEPWIKTPLTPTHPLNTRLYTDEADLC